MSWLSFLGCGSTVNLVFKVFGVLFILVCPILIPGQCSTPYLALKAFAVLILVGFMHRLLQGVPWGPMH